MNAVLDTAGGHLVDSLYDLNKTYWPEHDTVENRGKKPLIRDLVNHGILDWPTQALIHDVLSVSTYDLEQTLIAGREFDAENVVELPRGVAGDCHAMAAYGWVMNQKLSIVNGFADGCNCHSWLFDSKRNIVHEPTPIQRARYFGYIVESPMKFVLGEITRISRLFADGQLPRELALPFFLRWVKLLEKDMLED